ncbi:MAG: CBS domain-containing protein [Gammaproteobacteria bacterium]|nr:CBS domain-containing protein [Gammaproteobacteria bacterium]
MKGKVIKVRDVMREQHLEIEGLVTVKDALREMQAHNTEMAIVKKRDEHDAYGLILLSDIVKKVLAKDKAPNRVNVYEIMSKPVVPVDPELDVRYCARLFNRFGLSNAPVIKEGNVVGVVSYSELVFKGLAQLID